MIITVNIFVYMLTEFALDVYSYWKWKLVAQSCPTFCDPMDCSLQAPLSMEFSRQEYWSGLPFPSPGDLRDPGIKLRNRTQVSHIAGRFFTVWATRKAHVFLLKCNYSVYRQSSFYICYSFSSSEMLGRIVWERKLNSK